MKSSAVQTSIEGGYQLKKDQRRTPICDALEELKRNRVIPFDVPGHKRGMGNKELIHFFGEKCLSIDVNSMKPLDFLGQPTGVIKEAEELTAEAFGVSNAFFMVGGTTSSVQAMILAACKQGDKIILPRSVHRSVLGALVLCGAVPVYVPVHINDKLGIAMDSTAEAMIRAMDEHPEAKAVFVNNPAYYGMCQDVEKIASHARKYDMLLLADEAHGTHLYFGEGLPRAAMHAGADMASVSMHKSGGSLTQSSLLLCGERVNAGYVKQVINLTQTTSASYLLLAGLDIARKHLALNGKEAFSAVLGLAEYARTEINNIGGYCAFSTSLVNSGEVYDFDRTKLSVNTLGIGLAGIEVYDILRDEYDIQIEFGDIGNILAYISIGDNSKNIEMLISALAEIKRRYSTTGRDMMKQEYISPIVRLTPQAAFYAEKRSVTLSESVGHICGEFVMCYPPGIAIIAPGEEITGDTIDYIRYAKDKGCSLVGLEDTLTERVNVLFNV